MNKIYGKLLAHRGYPTRYPENSLIGIKAALEHGASAIEFDIQLSSDQVPIVFHDATLERVTGQTGDTTQTTWQILQALGNGETNRFGNQFSESRISSLEEIVSLLAQYPEATIFVEIKKHSLKYFGIKATMDRVLQTIKPILSQCVIISYVEEALSYTQESSSADIGWVLKKYDARSKLLATELSPQYLICNMQKINENGLPLWPGNWSWVLYETSVPDIALIWHQRGADYIETDSIGDMLKNNDK